MYSVLYTHTHTQLCFMSVEIKKIPSEMEVTPRYKLLLSKILGDSVTEWMDGVDGYPFDCYDY